MSAEPKSDEMGEETADQMIEEAEELKKQDENPDDDASAKAAEDSDAGKSTDDVEAAKEAKPENKKKKKKKAKAKKKVDPEEEQVKAGPDSMESEEGMRWYVVQAFSGFEKQAAKSLQDHVDRYDEMKELFGRILVPTEEVVEMKGGQKRTSERKFFPGYVLVEMTLTDESWHLVKGVPKITGFIGGTGTSPTPISDREASEIIQQLEEGADKPRPKFTFAAGEMVRVVDGPFQDFNGTVEDVNFEKSKLRVSVSIFGRSTPVELNFSQVEKS